MIRVLLTVAAVFTFSISVHAYEGKDIIENHEVEVVKIAPGHEMVYFKSVVIEDITTNEYRRIITRSGLDTSGIYMTIHTMSEM